MNSACPRSSPPPARSRSRVLTYRSRPRSARARNSSRPPIRTSPSAPAACSTRAQVTMLNNQVILIRGDKIVDVGPNLAIPAGARVIDLSNATVMPGMIDAHVHVVSDRAPALSAAERTLTRARQCADRSRRRLHDRARHGFARRLQHGRSARCDQCRPRDGTAHAGGRPVDQPARHQLLPPTWNPCASSTASSRTRTRTRPGSRAPPCARRNCAASIGSRSTRRRISRARSTCGRATRNWSIRPRSPSRRWRPSSMNRTGWV